MNAAATSKSKTYFDGKSPLEIQLPGPLNALKKPLLKLVKGNVIEKLLRDHDILKDNM